jgi:hypothetical protein
MSFQTEIYYLNSCDHGVYGHSGKDRMAYGGLVYYDNALYTGPNPYKGIFSVNSDYPETGEFI